MRGWRLYSPSSGIVQPPPQRVRVHLRAFEHPTRAEPARDIVMRIAGGTVEEMRELPRGREDTVTGCVCAGSEMSLDGVRCGWCVDVCGQARG